MIKTHTLAVRPSAQIRDKLRVKLSATDTAKAALLVFMMLLASSGALAAAAEPSPATPPVVTVGEGVSIIASVGLIAFLAKLVKSLGEIKSAGRSFVREEITLAAADKKGGEIPQPLVTKKHEQFATERALAEHIRRVGEMDAALRKELSLHMDKVSDELSELRKADAHHAERLTDKMEKLTLIVLEMSKRA